MEIVLVAIAALVCYAVFMDKPASDAGTSPRGRRVVRTPRRMVARRGRRRPTPRQHTAPLLGFLHRRPAGPLWWWE